MSDDDHIDETKPRRPEKKLPWWITPVSIFAGGMFYYIFQDWIGYFIVFLKTIALFFYFIFALFVAIGKAFGF